MATLGRISEAAQAVRDGAAHYRYSFIGVLAIAGGALIIAGTLLPWFTLFAGLQRFAGIDGLNGRLLLGGGVLSALAGAWLLRRKSRALRWAIGLLGFAQLAFCSWLLLGLARVTSQAASDPFIVAAAGPGLFVTALGALLVFATMFVNED